MKKLEEVLYDIFFASYIAPIILMKNSFNLKFIMYNSHVFVNPQTGDNYKEIKTGFNQAVKRANIENFTFHDLRHTVGTRLGNSGIDTGVYRNYWRIAKFPLRNVMCMLFLKEKSRL